jgi:hypothetical protein
MSNLNLAGSSLENRRLPTAQSEQICLMARQNGITAEQARYLLMRMANKH